MDKLNKMLFGVRILMHIKDVFWSLPIVHIYRTHAKSTYRYQE